MFSRLYLEITTCCNRACSFCPGTARPAAFVTPETFRTLAAKLRPYGQYLYLHVMGEPLLHPQLPTLFALAKARDMKICITTNGTLLSARGGELLCNRDTLVGTVLNLVENAIQACGPELRLKVHLYARADSLRLSVSDNGPGMDPATLARLGEPFFTTKTTGTGLGLAVVKAVARAHQGQLQLRSRPGRGTCATLILPLIPAAPLSAIQE